MATCNTVTCTGYSADVLGAGGLHGLQVKWIKNGNGDPLSWFNFSEDSAHFAGITWIGIAFAAGFASDTLLGRLRLFDCNNILFDQRDLILPTGASWGKWVFTANFGQSCLWTLNSHSWGTDPMPDTPPPV